MAYQTYEYTGTLAAGVATDVDIDINCATNWVIVLRNTGLVNTITALTVARSPLGTYFSAAVAVTTGIPLATSTSLTGINGLGEPIRTLRLTITSTGGTTYAIEGGGE